MKRRWTIALRCLPLCLLAVVLWREKPWTVALSATAPWAVTASILLNLAVFLPLKAARWRVALIEPPPYRQVLAATIEGLLASIAIGFGSGDMVRSARLRRPGGLPEANQIAVDYASSLAERGAEVFALGILVFAAALVTDLGALALALSGLAVAGYLAVLAVVFALIATACGSSNPLGGGEISGDLKSIKVGSADFTESKIIAELYAQALEANGFTVTRQFGIGSRETYIPAVQDHSIDLIPEYTGNLLQYFDKETPATTPDAVLLGLLKTLPGDLSILYPSPAEDKDTLAVTGATAQRLNLKSIADLATHSAEVKVGAPSEFQTRVTGLVGLKDKYGLDIAPANFIAISDGGGPATVKALTGNTVTSANIFSTSPSIEQNKLVVLEDPKNVFLAANVVPLVASQKMSNELKSVLDAVSAKLTTEALIDLNTSVEGNKGIDPDEAAEKWIKDNGFDKPVQK